ncbi:helix-turn-helix domain-containing protein [Paenibacillus sp. LjRoot153]|uniref:helix-turn-helix transcriptional regulator n=1 Tax=Paenibacillus sp. LjRoot153 TaxID=3342270 RepID=UPI003ECF33E3
MGTRQHPNLHALGDLVGLQPTVNYAEHLNQVNLASWGPRTIPDYQILFVIEGKVELRIGTRRLVLQAGDSCLYGPHSPHQITTLIENTSFYSVHFQWHADSVDPLHPAHDIREVSPECALQEPTTYTLDLWDANVIHFPPIFRIPSLGPLFLPIVDEYREQQPGYSLLLRAHLIVLLTTLARSQIVQQTQMERKKIAPALEAISASPHQSWTVQELAHLCGYNPTYFADLFRDLTGQAPKVYLLQVRTLKAKQLLLSGAKHADIAEALGYGSVHYFSRNFKESTGLTPSQFRMTTER